MSEGRVRKVIRAPLIGGATCLLARLDALLALTGRAALEDKANENEISQ